MKKQIIFFATLLFFTSFPAGATEVIVMVYSGRIILGVDSRISYTEKTGKRIGLTGAKLLEVNNALYAFSGYAGSYGNYSPGSRKLQYTVLY